MHKIMHAVVALSIIKGIVVGTIAYERFGMTGLILSAIVLPLLAWAFSHCLEVAHKNLTPLSRQLLVFVYFTITGTGRSSNHKTDQRPPYARGKSTVFRDF